MAILFYSTREQPYGCFSNFSAHRFEVDGRRWPTSEHYFQAQKFTDSDYAEKIRLTSSPMIAARLGRSRKQPIRPDWEAVKDDAMRRAVLAKFEQNESIQTILLGTDDEEIVENAPRDYYWGCGADGSGKNMLGIILMEVRATLRQQASEQGA